MLRLLLTCLLIPAAHAAPNTDPFPTLPDIKGLQVQMVPDALALGIHHAGINLDLTALLSTQPQPGHPTRTVDGHTFAFSPAYLASLDRQVKPLSDHGIAVYLILLAYPSKTPERDLITIHPGARADRRFTVAAFNSVTPQGRAYLRAATEFLAERWSGDQPQHGRVWGWIIGNEVNSHFLWYNHGNLPLDQAASQYENAFRLIHSAVRTASAHARLYIPFDHHWGVAMHGISAQEAVPGRDYLDTFARLVRQRGELDWHVAWHPYPEDLGNPRAWADKSVTDADSTPKVTFRNLQVLPRHLEQPELLYEGKPRRIILSEQGFHTLLKPEGEPLQAAAYAYAWEKCRRLPTIDAFIYHRHVDHAKEGGLRLGLWRNAPGSIADPHSKKEIWELFHQAGTPDWEKAAAKYLPHTGMESWQAP